MQFTLSSDRAAGTVRQGPPKRYDVGVRIASATRRRLGMTLAGLVAAAVLASSCSLDAAVETDLGGRVVGINALRIRSDALDLAVALALEGRQLVLELRWRQEPNEASRFF